MLNASVGSVQIVDGAISTDDIANLAVTAAKIVSGAVGGAQANQAQVQSRLSGTYEISRAEVSLAAGRK
ncbi:MAG: hypothetical protein U1F68_05410 [Gammaproteobacteria bacterium]